MKNIISHKREIKDFTDELAELLPPERVVRAKKDAKKAIFRIHLAELRKQNKYRNINRMNVIGANNDVVKVVMAINRGKALAQGKRPTFAKDKFLIEQRNQPFQIDGLAGAYVNIHVTSRNVGIQSHVLVPRR